MSSISLPRPYSSRKISAAGSTPARSRERLTSFFTAVRLTTGFAMVPAEISLISARMVSPSASASPRSFRRKAAPPSEKYRPVAPSSNGSV
ncbi:hypothetical protein D3C73_1460560 [compost metagenome]